MTDLPRLIPVLTVIDGLLYRTVRFSKPRYVGDPINALRIFNEKEVDELIVLEISPTRAWLDADWTLARDLASEAFMPLAWGGKLRDLSAVERIFGLGYEKVVLNTAAQTSPTLLYEIAKRFGQQAVVASLEIRRNLLGRLQVLTDLGRRKVAGMLTEHMCRLQDLGAGELLVTAVHCDGAMTGMDTEMLRQVSQAVSIPVIAMGGAGSLAHSSEAFKAGVSAVGAGSMFVFSGIHRAVLITYPTERERHEALAS